MNGQINCQFFKEHLNAYLDSELSQAERQQMIRHADLCPECGERLETMTRLLTMCAELDEGLTVPLNVQTAWRKAIRAEAESRRVPRRRGFTRVLGTVAAALVLLAGGTFAYRFAQLPSYEPAAEFGAAPMSAATNYSTDFDGAVRFANNLTGGVREDGGAMVMMIDGEVEPEPGSGPAVEDQTARQDINEPVVLRSAEREIESTSFDTDLQAISDLVVEYGGYFERSTVNGQPLTNGQGQGRVASMTARVRSDELDAFLSSLDVVGTLTYKYESAEDISSEYFDASSRLNSMKAQRDRLDEMVTTAADLNDLLALQNQLYQLQMDIDTLEGQLRGWSGMAQRSTVNIRLSEVAVRAQVNPIAVSLEERVRNAFYDSINWLGQFIQDAAVVLAMALPALVIAVPVLVIVCLIVACVRRRRRRKG